MIRRRRSRLSPVQKVQASKNSRCKLKQEQRNQVVLPSPHDSQLHLDIVPLAGTGEIKLQHRVEPILRCPRIERILVVTGCRSNFNIDRLSFVRIRNGEEVSEGREGEHEAQGNKDKPDAVNERREFPAENVGPASEPNDQNAPESNQNYCRSRRAVAGVPLIEQKVFRFAEKLKCRTVEIDCKGTAGGVVKPRHHVTDES